MGLGEDSMGSGQSTGGVGSSRGATSTGSTTSPDVEQVTPPFDAVARPVAAQLGQAVEAIPDHTACLREIGESGYEKAPRYKPRRHDSEQFKIRTYVGKDDKPIVAVRSRRRVPASDQALAKLARCCDRMFGG